MRDMELNKIYQGDALLELKKLPTGKINCCVTSPPYFGLRDYGVEGQIGLESTLEEYIGKMVDIFREVRRVLRDDGTLWLNLGDSYAGSGQGSGTVKPTDKQASNKGTLSLMIRESSLKKINGLKSKDLIGIPWMVAFVLRNDGYYLRQDIIWSKPNPMPESVTDRCTKAHEYIFLLSKSAKYYYDYKAIQEKSIWAEKDKRFLNGPTISLKSKSNQYSINKQGVYSKDGNKNKRSVWIIKTNNFKDAHFATFPPDLIIPCILAGCPEGGTVLDPFMGSGTTGLVALQFNRNFIGIELNKNYVNMANKRIEDYKSQLRMF
jgi:DNA modification methylase